MAAPTKIETHGAAALRPVVDEPSDTPALKVSEFTFEDYRNVQEVKDVDDATVKTKGTDPKANMTLKGQAFLATGIVAANTASKVASLANFVSGTGINGYDPADGGSIIVKSNKSTVGRIPDQLNVDLAVTYYPFVTDP